METDSTLEADLAADRRVATAAPPGTDLVARLARAGIESRLFSQPSATVSVGKYEIRGELGTGGMGVVYRAHDPELDRPVALKLLNTARAKSVDAEQAKTRLLREARAMARLAHPNVLTVHEVGTFEEQVYVAMEFVEGETLDAWLEHETRAYRDVLEVFLQAARGLAAAHEEGIVHRDFKPQNVMLSHRGRARVLDFGLARSVETPDDAPALPPDIDHESASLTRTGALVGTPAYMAPEQYSGRPADARSDQFSFCVALWEAVFGCRPFKGNTVAAIADSVTAGTIDPPPQGRAPGWLRRVLVRGLSKDPAARYASMTALIGALEAGQRESALRRWLPALAAVAVLATAAVIALPSDDPLQASPRAMPSIARSDEPATVAPVAYPLPLGGPAPQPAPAEPEPEPVAKRSPAKPPRPRFSAKWCYHTEERTPIAVGFEKQPKMRARFTVRDKCWTCRKAPAATHKQFSRRDCENFAVCVRCDG